MANPLRRWWKYRVAKLDSDLESRADPKIQLEQAISDAQSQHRLLVEQAANVVANQKQSELRLTRALEELERVGISTRQALRMAEEASAQGDSQKASEYNQTAEAFANRLVATEQQVEDLKATSLQASAAADQARAAVKKNSAVLQQKLAERQKLLSQLDQAKMQEQLNRAMSSLSETVDQDGPTLDQVREKIEARYARALGASELAGDSVESRMLEVEQASIGSEARSRLDQMRAEMGIAGASPAGLPHATQSEIAGTTASSSTPELGGNPQVGSQPSDSNPPEGS